MISKRRSFIVGIKGIKLSPKEITFLKKYRPWGIILFSRNIKSFNQTKNLTLSIKKIFKDKNYPILIDQEGGNVSRIEKLITARAFSGYYFGSSYLNDKKNISNLINVYVDQLSYLLKEIGININTAPVLDIRRNFTNKVLFDRSFSNNKKLVKKIGTLFIEKFHKNKILTVMKHIPGHGLATNDSHFLTPVVTKKLSYLNKNDFFPFKKQKCLFAMTAHIIFKSIDPNLTVTHSKKIIKIIRKKIGFKNIIISDDLSMKALKFSLVENTKKAFSAGCNIVLHCNGKISEMKEVAINSPKLNGFLMKKTLEFYKTVN